MNAGPPRRGDDAEAHVLLAIAGSDEAFGEVVRLHQGARIALLTRVCGNRAAAEDAVQTAFVKAWRNIRSLRDAALFRPWLRQIAMRAAIDAARAHAGADELDVESLSDQAAISADTRLDLDAALRKLSVAQRACVLLAYAEGMSHGEIATVLNIPTGTVKSHVARGARTLRELLSDKEV